ncbi:MAG: hypothetical protein JSW01_00730 [Candidatus Bathyarchaeota archaeon]|nr:MAG: hypothetical protein JSW01_00730 [Candidatus Bathyarchaeota archaeon]
MNQEEDRGRIEIRWDNDDLESIESAREEFVKYTRLGWIGFATMLDGRHIQVLSFDPSLEKITLIMPVEGGSPENKSRKTSRRYKNRYAFIGTGIND